MKIKDLFAHARSVRPNTFPDEVLLLWLNELEGRVQLDIMLRSPEELTAYTLPENWETQLLVQSPHTGLYRHWMAAMIDLENGEHDRYQNDMTLFNRAAEEYACWHAEKRSEVRS